jgi:hypothetical protein
LGNLLNQSRGRAKKLRKLFYLAARF